MLLFLEHFILSSVVGRQEIYFVLSIKRTNNRTNMNVIVLGALYTQVSFLLDEAFNQSGSSNAQYAQLICFYNTT